MDNELHHVDIYTDGSCLENPGPGGWCAILTNGARSKTFSGNEKYTTNNRMELMAAIEGLKALKRPCEVTLYSDSRYLVDSMSKLWVSSWSKNGWKKSDRSDVKNKEMWEQLQALCKTHRVSFIWVKGHNGNEMNEICNEVAQSEAASAQ